MQVFKKRQNNAYNVHHGVPAVKLLVPPDEHSTLSMPVQLEKGQKVCFSITYYNDNRVMKVRVLKGKDNIYRTDLNVSS
jgi:predicted RNA-binding protein (virulence factor B family)